MVSTDIKPHVAEFTHLISEDTGANIWSHMKASEGGKFEEANAQFVRKQITGDATYAFENGTVLNISKAGLRLDGSPVELKSNNILITKDGAEQGAFIRTFK